MTKERFTNTDTVSLAEKIAEKAMTVGLTFGPNGRLVLIEPKGNRLPYTTQDGYTVIREMKEKDPSLAAKLLVDAAEKVAQRAGDGTTTTCLLIALALKYNVSLKDTDISPFIEGIKKEAVEGDVIDVASTATKDKAIGEAIGKLVWRLGRDGHIEAELGAKFETSVISGYELPGHLLLPQALQLKHNLIYNGPAHITVKDPLIVSIAHTFSGVEGIKKILTDYQQKYYNGDIFLRPLILIFADIEKEPLDVLAINLARHNYPVIPVSIAEKRPMMRHNFLTDLKYLTDAPVYSTLGAKKIRATDGHGFTGIYGECRSAYLSLDRVRFVSDRSADYRIDFIKANAGGEDKLKEDDRKRISLLQGAIGKIVIPITTHTEHGNLELIIEDGVRSAQAVIKHGLYTGGPVFWHQLGEEYPQLHDICSTIRDMLPDGHPSDSVLAIREAYLTAASLVDQLNRVAYVL